MTTMTATTSLIQKLQAADIVGRAVIRGSDLVALRYSPEQDALLMVRPGRCGQPMRSAADIRALGAEMLSDARFQSKYRDGVVLHEAEWTALANLSVTDEELAEWVADRRAAAAPQRARAAELAETSKLLARADLRARRLAIVRGYRAALREPPATKGEIADAEAVNRHYLTSEGRIAAIAAVLPVLSELEAVEINESGPSLAYDRAYGHGLRYGHAYCLQRIAEVEAKLEVA